MQHPNHEILTAKPQMSRQRMIGLGLVGLLHVVFVWALIDGLATRIAVKIPQELKATVISPTKPETVTAPPPPQMVTPKDAVAPPEITVQTDQSTSIQAKIAPATPSSPDTKASGMTSTHTTPPYPPGEKEAGHQGTVTLHITVSATGDVQNAQVTKSSGFPVLDQTAVQWVTSHWKYKPAMQGGVAVASASDAQVVFNLKNAS